MNNSFFAPFFNRILRNIKKKADAMGIRMSDYVRMVLTHADQYEVGIKFQAEDKVTPQNTPGD